MKQTDHLKLYWLGKQLITMYVPEKTYSYWDAVLWVISIVVIFWTLWMVSPS